MLFFRKKYSGQRKLVLAFDIGTTYSGISYCILQPGQIPEIRGVTRFPGQAEGCGNAKVPSILYYDAKGNIKAVGSEALSLNVINDVEENGWTKAEWWKLHFRPKHLPSAHIKDEDVPALPPGKFAVDILTDFIKYLFTCARKHIEEHHMGFDWASVENSVEFILSHPNGWEGPQQQKYRQAVEKAGLILRTPVEQSRVHMITEGEASLHYCISSLSEEPTNTEPQGIVIIDAGGGTIDLSMYSVTFNPTACKEIAPAECHLQGSVFVTRRAANLLSRKLEGSPHSSTEEMAELTRKFDETTKLIIRSPDEPVYFTVGGLRYNNPKFNIKRGALKLSGEEATSLFCESIEAIITAFEEQRKAANTKITMAFLVGGLGMNDFVWARLQAYFNAQRIKICRPDNDVNKAVANGSVLFYNNHAVQSRIARATYGVQVSRLVDQYNPEHRRRINQWEESPSGEYEIYGGFCPILCKGSRVDEQKETYHRFFFTSKHQGNNSGQCTMFCYHGTLSNPQWLDEDPSSFTQLCKIKVDLGRVMKNATEKIGVSGRVYYRVPVEMVTFFGATELSAQVAWNDNGIEERTPTKIVYIDD